MMKKSAIALAVAAALAASAAAQAETTLYGSARVSVDWVDPDVDEGYAEAISYSGSNSSYMQVANNSSRLGVRGSEDLGGGLSAIYTYEFGVDITGGSQAGTNYFNSNRPRWAGLKGGFGEIKAGVQWTPTYNGTVGYFDTFNSDLKNQFFLSGDRILNVPIGFVKGIQTNRRGTSVTYKTPSWNGLTAEAMAVMDGDTGDTATVNRPNYVDIWEANLVYANGPFFAGAAVIQDRNEYQSGGVTSQSDMQYSVALGWNNGTFGIGGLWQQFNPDNDFALQLSNCSTPGDTTCTISQPARGKVNNWSVQGSYTFGNNILRATYGYTKPDDDDSPTAQTVEVGFQHNLSKRTRLWVEYFYNSYGVSGLTTQGLINAGASQAAADEIADANDSKGNAVSVGIRHDF